jgi:hypothetical protein
MMLSISNFYAHGYDPTQVEALRRLGFKFRQPTSTFAGSQILYFVDFTRGPALEFIQVEDEGEYQDFLPEGMVAYCPGISLLLPEDSEKSLRDFQVSMQEWEPNIKYVNDEGGDDPVKPGWSYLNFAEPIIRDTFIYLSSRIGLKHDQTVITDHPNRVTGVTDMIFDLDDTDLAKLAKLTQTELAEGVIEVEGVRIGSRRIWKGSIDLPQKQFPLAAIVLQAGNLDTFLGQEGVNLIDFHGKPAAHIQMNELSWDLIVTT